MLWARVIRGISSMARKLTPRSASERAASTAVSGSPNPISACPGRSSARSAAPVSGLAPGERTCTTTSADWNTSCAAIGDAHALVGVFGIRESGAQARSGFHQELGASLIENGDCARNHGHPALARRYFGNYTDSHSKYGSP